MVESGLKGHEYQLMFSDQQHSSLILAHPVVAALTFTGTTSNAKTLASISASYFKKQLLMLSTSDPFIIFKDAHLDHTLKTLL